MGEQTEDSGFPKRVTKKFEKGDKKFTKGFKSESQSDVTKTANIVSSNGKRRNDHNLNAEVPAKKRFGDLETSEGGKPDWAKMRQERKALKTKRKIKESKPGMYDLGQEAKQIWEELRQESCPANKRTELSTKLYTMLGPHLQKVIFAHDIVRVIECMVAVGGPKIRQGIFDAIKVDLLLAMKSTYAHFLVLKILKYGNKSQRDEIMKSFEGNVVSLMKHKIASSVVEYAYNDFANAFQRFKIVKEFYGPEFRLLTDSDCINLKSVLEKHPAKKQNILNNMRGVLLKLMEKEQWKLTMFHTLLYEFLSNCDPDSRTDLIPLVSRGICDILHTRDGSRVGMICIWYGTPKDRKQIIKAMKPMVEKICLEEHGHMVMLALLDCVDDTALLGKAIIQEIVKSLEPLMANQHGRKVLHYILTPAASQFFHPNILAILKEGEGKSKKEPSIRRGEVLAACHSDIIDSIVNNVKTWGEDNGACMVMSSALTVGTVNKEQAFTAISKLAMETPTAEFVEKPGAFKLLKNLLTAEPNANAKESNFANTLVEHFTEDVLNEWISCNRGCLLIVKILESSGAASEKLFTLVKPLKKKITTKDSPGAKIILKLIK